MTAKLKYSLLSIIFILGYTSLSFELIILRQMINFIGSNTLITSVIISFVLLFLSVGYYIGSTISFLKYNIRKISNRIILCLSLWYIVACLYPVINLIFLTMYSSGIISPLYQAIVLSFILLVLPSIGLGFISSVFGRIIHHSDFNYTGRFMAFDTIGSVFGSLITTLVLMPIFGVYSSIIILVFLTSSILFLISKKRKIFDNIVLCFIFTFLSFIFSYTPYGKKNINNKTLYLDNSIARLEIQELDFIDNKPQSKLMYINGSYSSKISNNNNLMFEYINYINKNFINNLPKNKTHNILVLGTGGFTVGKDDTYNNYTYLDIIKELKDISENHFLDKKLTNNKKFITQDGYLYMLKSNKKYDIIILDVYSSSKSIPENFLTVDFFNLVKKNLNKDGIMIANIITSPSFNTKYSKRIDNTLKYVFSNYLSRQIIYYDNFNPYNDNDVANIIYVYFNKDIDNTIYTINKNSSFFEK